MVLSGEVYPAETTSFGLIVMILGDISSEI